MGRCFPEIPFSLEPGNGFGCKSQLEMVSQSSEAKAVRWDNRSTLSTGPSPNLQHPEVMPLIKSVRQPRSGGGGNWEGPPQCQGATQGSLGACS